jgi:hypothetical protein
MQIVVFDDHGHEDVYSPEVRWDSEYMDLLEFGLIEDEKLLKIAEALPFKQRNDFEGEGHAAI